MPEAFLKLMDEDSAMHDDVRPVKVHVRNFGLACHILQVVVLFCTEGDYCIMQTNRHQRRDLTRYGITYHDNVKLE
jgi:hypothetical protein